MSAPILDSIVDLSGLSGVFARDAIVRACQRAGIEPAQLSPANLEGVLPHIARTLKVFLPKDEAARRLSEIQALGGR